MTKMELIDHLAQKADISKKAAREKLEDVLEGICDALASDEKCQIADFGTFKVVTRAATVRKNPRTGESVNVPERKTVTFKPVKGLKDSFN
jgi:DNA-binding protein HU-beta